MRKTVLRNGVLFLVLSVASLLFVVKMAFGIGPPPAFDFAARVDTLFPNFFKLPPFGRLRFFRY